MAFDYDRMVEALERVSEHYTAADLAEALDLDVWDLIEYFKDQILDCHEVMVTIGFVE